MTPIFLFFEVLAVILLGYMITVIRRNHLPVFSAENEGWKSIKLRIHTTDDRDPSFVFFIRMMSWSNKLGIVLRAGRTYEIFKIQLEIPYLILISISIDGSAIIPLDRLIQLQKEMESKGS